MINNRFDIEGPNSWGKVDSAYTMRGAVKRIMDYWLADTGDGLPEATEADYAIIDRKTGKRYDAAGYEK